MFHRSISAGAFVAALWVASPSVAQDQSAEILFEALGLPDIIDIMREEGIVYGAQVGTDLFPSRVGPSWSAAVETIYDAEVMQRDVKAAFIASLDGDDVAAMTAFFTSDLGRRFVDLEVAARRALLDEETDTASKALAATARARNSARFQIVDAFVQTNDLIETNVVGALNSNYAFYTGLMKGGAFEDALTEDQILRDVQDQEPDIRANTAEWVYSFLMLAYDPVSDADLQAYIAFSKSEAGQQLNDTLFDAFDDYFDAISYKLGFEAARMMTGAEL